MEINNSKNEIFIKILKVKALADRGIDGERELAQKVLNDLCKKYKISIEELNSETKTFRYFQVRSSVKNIFFQVYVSMFGATVRFRTENSVTKTKTGFEIRTQLTDSEFIDFSQLWDWHRKNYLKERKNIKKYFYLGYLDKHKLYPSEIDETFKKTNKEKDISLSDVLAIKSMAGLCNDKTFYKALTSPNED